MAQAPQQRIWSQAFAKGPHGNSNPAVVRAVRGEAEVRVHGKWMKATVGASIPEGAIIRTADNCAVELLLKENGPILRVNAATSIKLVRLRLAKSAATRQVETMLELLDGQVFGKAFTNGPSSSFLIRTEYGTAYIEGGCYSINSNAELHVLSGAAQIYKDNAPPNPPNLFQGFGDHALPGADPCSVFQQDGIEAYAPP